MLPPSLNILVFGASYGALLATKIVLAGHNATLICLPSEADIINAEGVRLRMPVRGRNDLVEVDTNRAAGTLKAGSPNDFDPKDFDLVVLAMQEPQYGAADVGRLLGRVADAEVPCMSIMNMPPSAFLSRIATIDVSGLEPCYATFSAWSRFNPDLMTLASPDAQAFRPPNEAANVLQVSLPTNFKVAPFGVGSATAMVHRLAADIENVRYALDDGSDVELPVKLRPHHSIFVPLAKWAMLMTGNYRCIQEAGVQSIREAVHGDIAQSQNVYEWVCKVCMTLGAAEDDLVPFEKYAAAAKGLAKPSSVARALDAGSTRVERVDKLVRDIAFQNGLRSDAVDRIVLRVDETLERNHAMAS